MANTVIQLRNSTVTGNVPSSLANGEISINSRDGKFFYSTPAGVVVTHYPYPGPAGLNQEVQFNDSGVLGSDSGLTYNKTTDVLTVVGGAIVGGVNVTPQIQLAFTQANTPSHVANSAASYANSAYTRANNSINANTGGTIIGNVTVIGNVSSNLISFNTTGLVPIELTPDNTVSSFRYTGKNLYIGTYETGPTGIRFNSDGTRMFVGMANSLRITQYNLSTPWNITTASATAQSNQFTTDFSPQEFHFSSDGLTLFILGEQNDRVYQHSLSSAFSISTVNTFPFTSFSISGVESQAAGLWFNPAGTKMFVSGYVGDSISEYSLGTAYNLSGSVTFVRTVALLSPTGTYADSGPSSISFNADGTRLFVSGITGEEINEYSLSTGFDTSTLTWKSYKYVGTQNVNPTGIFSALANNSFYFVSSNDLRVYQYSTNENSLVANTHNFNVGGNSSIEYDQTVMGNQFIQGTQTVYGNTTLQRLTTTSTATFQSTSTFQSTATFQSTILATSTITLNGSSSSTTVLGTSALTGTTTIGGASQSGTITIGQSTVSQTLNIANGATTSTNTKTVYIGAAGLSGSQTNVIIGSTISGSRGNTHIFTPNVLITAANTAQTSIRIIGGRASTSNSTGTIVVNGGVGVNGSIYADAIYDGGVEIINFAGGAFNTANASFLVANGAAFVANTDFTTISTTAGVYGNAAFHPVITLAANGRISSITNTAIAISTDAITSGTLAVTRGGTGVITSTGTGSVTLNTSPTLSNVSVTGSTVVSGNVRANYVVANTAFASVAGLSKLELSDIGLVGITVAGQTFQFGGSGIESNQGIFGGSFGGNRLSLNNETNLISNRYDTVKIQTGTDGTTVNDFIFANNSFSAPGNINVATRVDWTGTGYAQPSFTTRSAGQKLTLYPAISSSAVDYSIGIDGGVLWSTVPVSSNEYSFKWYGGQTQIASLSGVGVLDVISANIISSNTSTSNTTGALRVTGGVGVRGNVATDGVIFADGTRQTTAASGGGASIGDVLALAIALG